MKYRSKIIDPGEMNESVIIRNYTTLKKANGEEILTFSDWSTVWAKYEQKGVNERYVNDQETNLYDGLLTIRYLSGIDEKMRVSIGSEIFDIEGLQYDPAKRFHFIKIIKRK
jgi:SPP1 family predicted phage head-tail adaptor